MPKFLIWSDLHIERREFAIPTLNELPANPDAVLIAGDTDTSLDHVDFAQRVSASYDCPIIMVDGNHEYYGQNIDRFADLEAEKLASARSRGHDIHILHGQSVVVGGVRIIGATLWTDFDLDLVTSFAAKKTAMFAIEDYKAIKVGAQGRAIRPEDTIARHVAEKRAILSLLEVPHDGPTLVMTHHLPIKQALNPKHHGNPLNAAFASDLAHELAPYDWDAWIFGHSHDSRSFELEIGEYSRRFIANTRGYLHDKTAFDPRLMLTF